MASTTETGVKHTYSTRMSDRRKALFPDSDNDSDLGRISPLSSDTNSGDAENTRRTSKLFSTTIDDYVFLDQEESKGPDPGSESNMSALCISPYRRVNSPVVINSSPFTSRLLAPFGKSPTSNMKTPHDTSTVKQNSKQTKRKLVDNIDDKSSPLTRNLKLESHKNSKVRTSLFHDTSELSLPTKSFYPKKEDSFRFKPVASSSNKITKRETHRKPTFKIRKRFGQINAGVGHKIKKPKLKKRARQTILKSAINIMENSPINDTLNEIAQFKKTIKPLPMANKNKENKENVPAIETVSPNENSERKFFRFTRSQKAAEETEVAKNNKRKLEDSFDLAHDISIEKPSAINDIINYLDNGDITENAVLKPELLLSPTSQMCDMASVLDLNSPKRAKLNITSILEQNTFEKDQKLYPLFYNETQTTVKQAKVVKTTHNKRFKPTSDDQMLLDAGQKKFGATECHICKFIYDAGDANDEMEHDKYHSGTNIFRYNNWKNERIVSELSPSDKILKIIPGDSKSWWNKANEVLTFVNRELGFYDGLLPIEKSQVYLYIKNKQIIACLVAELKTKAYKLLSSEESIDLCSQESYSVRCGISRIWVAENRRHNGIGTELMNALRRNFLYGYILKNEDIAMSSPTDDGKRFAKKYFSNENFLIYLD